MELVEIIFLKNLYYTITLLLVLMFAVSISANFKKYKDLSRIKNFLLISFSISIALFFGLRDFNVGFDTNTYKYLFEYEFIAAEKFVPTRDSLWDFFNYIIAQFTNDVTFVFLIVAFGYIMLPLFGVYKYLKQNTIFFFLLFIISPNFFLYGANGIRNGLAASIVLFSLKYYKNYKQYIIMLLASLVHLSMILPFLFFYVSKYVKKLRYPLIIWTILLIFALSGVNILSLLPFSLDRLDGYIEAERGLTDKMIIITNFLIYSVSPIIVGLYVIYVKKCKDDLYIRLLVTYILTNCIYIAAFNSSFSERFAYLSEFLMPLLLVYPLLKFRIWKYVELKLTLILAFVFFIKSYKIFIM